MQLDAASSITVSLNLPVPEPISFNHTNENCDNEVSVKKRKLATVTREYGDKNESGWKLRA